MTSADTAKHKGSVLAFINALLHGFRDNLVERARLREQLLAGQITSSVCRIGAGRLA